MNKEPHFPNFAELIAISFRASAARREFIAYVPWFLSLCIALGVGSSYALALAYNPEVSKPDAIATLSAMIVVGGLLMAVSIACMTQIYVTVSDPLFGDYLKDEDVFDQFLYWPQLTLLMQILYVVMVSCGLVGALSTSENFVRMTVVTTAIWLLLYTTTKTWQLVEALRLLAWHRQEYASLLLKAQQSKM